MTQNPNIKTEILYWIFKESALQDGSLEGGTYSMVDCADELGYEQSRVCRKVGEMYPLLDYGTSPRFPWIGPVEKGDIREQLNEWGSPIGN